MFKCLLAIMLIIGAVSANARQLDPTQPLAKSAIEKGSATQNFKLFSVMILGETRKAIINDKTLIIGDTLGEFKLIKIEKQKVVLQSSSDTIELSLFTSALTNK